MLQNTVASHALLLIITWAKHMVVSVADMWKHETVITPTTSLVQSGLVSAVVTVVGFHFHCFKLPSSLHILWGFDWEGEWCRKREGGEGGVCLQNPPLSLASLPRRSAAFPCPHSAVSNRRGLQGEAGWIQTGMGLKETYCEVTFFPNADRSQVSSWRNYPHESCPLWCLPRMRTWKGIRYDRVLSASRSEPDSHLLQAAWSARCVRAHVECPWMWNSSTAMCCYLRVCCSQVAAHFSIHARPPVCALPSLPFTQRSLW